MVVLNFIVSAALLVTAWIIDQKLLRIIELLEEEKELFDDEDDNERPFGLGSK